MATSESPEEVVRKAHAAFSRGDVDAFVSCWSPDCVFQPGIERAVEGPDEGFRGHQGLREWWREYTETWDDLSSEVHEVRTAGDEVLVAITLHATGKASGAVVAAPFYQVGTIRDGKIIRSRDFADRAEAVEAAGLSE